MTGRASTVVPLLVTLTVVGAVLVASCAPQVYRATGAPTSASRGGSALGSITPASGTLTAGAITPTSPTIDRGQSIELMANPSGGTTPYTFVWYNGTSTTCAGDSVISGQTGRDLNLTSQGLGAYYCYEVTDSSTPTHQTATSATNGLAVNPLPLASAITPGAPVIDLGQSVTLTAHPDFGTQPYHYQWWSGASSTCSSDTTAVGTDAATYVAAPTASTYYCYVLTDSAVGTPAASSASATDQVTVDPALVAGDVTPNAPVIDSGRSVPLFANPTGGTGTYSYQWYTGSSSTCANDLTLVGTDSNTYTAGPAATAYFCYGVTDTSTNPPTVLSATDLVTVNPVLVAGAITPASPGIDVGQSVTLTANPSGGQSPYTYQWISGSYSVCASDTAVTGATTRYFTVTPTASFYLCYNATDSYTPSETATSATTLVSVNPQPSASPITPDAPIIDVGQSVTLTAQPAPGTGTPPYHFQWLSGSSPNCASDTTPVGADSATYVASPVSTRYYCYILADSSVGTPAATSVSATDEVIVHAALIAGPMTPSVPGLDLGQSVIFTANANGGTPILTYEWYAGVSSNCSDDAAILGETGTTYLAKPTAAIYYCYSVSDGSTNPPTVFSPSQAVTVNPALAAGPISPGSPSAPSGKTAMLTANATGGTPPYTFYWYAGNSTNCSQDALVGTGLAYNASSGGSGYFCFVVTDSSPGTPAARQSSVAVRVVVPSNPTFLGLPAWEGYALLAGVVLVGAACVAVVLLIRRRRGRRGVRISELM